MVEAFKVNSITATNDAGTVVDLNGATINPNSKITLVFNKEIDSTTISTSNFRVFMNGIVQATGTVALDSSDKTKVTITAPAAGYTVNKAAVLKLTTAIKSTTGDVFAGQEINFNVTAKPVVLSQTYTTTAPATTTITAGGTLTDLTLGTALKYTFNTTMSESTVTNTNNVKFYNVTDSKWETVTLGLVGNVLTVTLPALDNDKEYKMVFTADIKTLAGSAMTATEMKYFTGSAPTLSMTLPNPSTNVYNSIIATPGKAAVKWVGTFTAAVDPATVIGDNIKLRELSATGTVVATTIAMTVLHPQ